MNPQVLLHPHPSCSHTQHPVPQWGGEQNSHSWELFGMAAWEAGLQGASTQPHRCHMHRSPSSPPFPFPHPSLSTWKIQFLPQNTQTLQPCPHFHPCSPGVVTWAVLGEQLDLMILQGFSQLNYSAIHSPRIMQWFVHANAPAN